ncbi:MAG: glycoside hydrolase N-terminal domain-containing protein [Clostridiaceae bacterium]|nr:glycoside hydrolase N-terminal domain-containing protein [Clostridiaceae bacterium]
MKKRRIAASLLVMLSLLVTSCSFGGDTEQKEEKELVRENKVKDTLKLSYDEPAEFWETNSLPIGNGYMGASIMGGIEEESICLNEKTLWTGGPSEERSDYNGGNLESASGALEKVQKALADGDTDQVDSLMSQLVGDTEGYGAYQTLGSVLFSFDQVSSKKTENYQRYLDLNQSVAGVSFDCGNTTYTREYFANYPSNVIVMRFSAQGEEKLNFKAKMNINTTQYGAKIEASDTDLLYYGELTDNQLRYESRFHFILKDGTAKAGKKSVVISDATEVIVLFTAATDYSNVYPSYRSAEDPKDRVDSAIEAAADKGYDALLKEHQEDYQALFGKASVSFGGEYTETCTDDLLKQYQKNDSSEPTTDDLYLEELYYQYGRYLLISSSREGSLPANLQGVWNNSNSPTWASDYHINVNLQMNYWAATVANLSETMIPFVEYVDSLREPGRETAGIYYGIESDEENPENGWVAHTQSTPFGWTCPGWEYTWGWSSAATAWLDQNLWDYYQFTADTQYLEEKIYPIMKESALFYTQFLIYDEEQGRYVSSPTYSPEHGPVTIGNTYEQSLIQDLLQNFVTASELLGKDEELRETAREMASKMDPYQISEETGLLKEWYEEDDEDFDDSSVEKAHRHTSHLLGLYPGNEINYDTTDLLEAAKASLNDRGDESTGWARAMKVCLWSRTGDGDRSYQILHGLLADSTYENLWDTHPPFQIDGNFGGTAGISEMLLQSHMGYIQVLPALPDAWKDGEFDGLCARNGFELQAKWSNKTLTELSVLSTAAKECKIQIDACRVTDSSGNEVETSYEDGILSFETEKNETYTLAVGE